MLANGVSPLASVLQIPQHGTARAIDEEFLASVQPQIALLQCDTGNRRDDPDSDTMDQVLRPLLPKAFAALLAELPDETKEKVWRALKTCNIRNLPDDLDEKTRAMIDDLPLFRTGKSGPIHLRTDGQTVTVFR